MTGFQGSDVANISYRNAVVREKAETIFLTPFKALTTPSLIVPWSVVARAESAGVAF